MDTHSNPYQAPNATQTEVADGKSHSARKKPVFSLFMIVAGAFFFVVSFSSVLGGGVDFLMSSYRELGWFPFSFMIFYGFAGGFTTIFHLSYLVRGGPQRSLAGMYAVAIASGLVAVAVVVMEFIA